VTWPFARRIARRFAALTRRIARRIGASDQPIARRIGAREHGFVALELAVGIGLLVLPVACLVVTLPTWSERQTTARAIAREVGRTTATAGVCDRAEAEATTREMAANLGLGPGDVSVALDCRPGARLARGGTVTARVTVQVPAVALPGIGPAGAWSWTAAHTEPVDPYRSFP
jgi:hypothetical protein